MKNYLWLLSKNPFQINNFVRKRIDEKKKIKSSTHIPVPSMRCISSWNLWVKWYIYQNTHKNKFIPYHFQSNIHTHNLSDYFIKNNDNFIRFLSVPDFNKISWFYFLMKTTKNNKMLKSLLQKLWFSIKWNMFSFFTEIHHRSIYSIQFSNV